MSDEFLRGTITAVGTAAGDRFVVGAWCESVIGPFSDVMWSSADGTRTLLAPTISVAEYVGGIYQFDQTEIVPWEVAASPTETTVAAGRIDLAAAASGGGRVPFARPWWFTRWVEGPIARRLMGVETHGVSPLGIEEWYQARAWRWVDEATIAVDGVDQGPVMPPTPALGVGFSQPPPCVSITDVRVRVRR